jgi:hypothetical protein
MPAKAPLEFGDQRKGRRVAEAVRGYRPVEVTILSRSPIAAPCQQARMDRGASASASLIVRSIKASSCQKATRSPPFSRAWRAPRPVSPPPATGLRGWCGCGGPARRWTWRAPGRHRGCPPADADAAAHRRCHGDHRHLVAAGGQHRELVVVAEQLVGDALHVLRFSGRRRCRRGRRRRTG